MDLSQHPHLIDIKRAGGFPRATLLLGGRIISDPISLIPNLCFSSHCEE